MFKVLVPFGVASPFSIMLFMLLGEILRSREEKYFGQSLVY